ncbi:MAG TPA: asparagine synthase C-terminal domain-containing protein [Candidatus Pacearchaeota archaeon]|nr:asparagine synthase C-terminal domain-containing protein [Candidatus Pacearchaeota archaeon]HOL90470.1 asparagine synthase C-terminal domain-containing protein [Candidatus Pacearchaeota archaeon]HPO68158.1 asparagine synthase C-terminal domain-containing protein [Candidatus Pacearchaeota archaeon]
MQQKLTYYKNRLFRLLDETIKNNCPDAVLLSGGIDSSVITLLGKKYNKNLKVITVIKNKINSPDQKFAKIVSRKINIKTHLFVTINDEEIPRLIKKVVLILENFNIYWVSAGIVLLKGLGIAKKNDIATIATGEGSDDLFGSFPVMLNWKDDDDSLKEFINIRMKDINVMTEKIANYLGIKIIMPFYDLNIINFALKIPLKYRIKKSKDGTKITKYILRKAFEKKLPNIIINRPQMMAFTGASTLDFLIKKYNNYADIDKYRNKYNINFGSGFECFLFDILNSNNKYKPIKNGNKCLYCSSKLRAKNSVYCTTCGMLQYNNKILNF